MIASFQTTIYRAECNLCGTLCGDFGDTEQRARTISWNSGFVYVSTPLLKADICDLCYKAIDLAFREMNS